MLGYGLLGTFVAIAVIVLIVRAPRTIQPTKTDHAHHSRSPDQGKFLLHGP
jgi:hypothetical protein